MLKKLFFISVVILGLVGVIWAYTPSDFVRYTAIYTADQTSIKAAPGYFFGITVMTDGTNACTVVTYDNTTNAGANKLHPDWVVTTSATDRAKTYSPPYPLAYDTGISVDITVGGGGTCSYQILYQDK
jgi:hypothetical protein